MVVRLFYNKFRNLRNKGLICINKLIYGDKFIYKGDLYVRKGFTIVIEENGKIEIGKNVFFNNFCSLNSIEEIKVGDNCIFGENVHIYDHNHIYTNSQIPVNLQGFTKKRIEIGNNCWFGSNVTILKGVTIGNHCVIGANCVIFSDVPDNSMIINKQQQVVKNI